MPKTRKAGGEGRGALFGRRPRDMLCKESRTIEVFSAAGESADDFAASLANFGYIPCAHGSVPDAGSPVRSEACLLLCDEPDRHADAVAAVRAACAERPLIFISRRGDLAARLAAVRAGGVAYFTRPLDIAALAETLDRLTGMQPVDPPRILVVEDSPSLAAFYSATLAAADMSVKVVTDPLRVMEALMEAPPDLILMDVYMPGANGMELARVLRQQEAFVSVPIVFLAAETEASRQHAAMDLGGHEFLVKPVAPERLVAAVRHRAARYRELNKLMVRDSLTGLLNHTATKERLDVELARARRTDRPLAVAMVDIDRFKNVNDSYGHPAGDRVIKALSRLMLQRLRRTDIVGRYGGEEFLVVLPDATVAAARALLDEIRDVFASLAHIAGPSVFTVTLSAGIAQCPPHCGGDEITVAADTALYRAKEGGRNRVECSDQH